MSSSNQGLDITFSNYGKYLNTNVFLQKTRSFSKPNSSVLEIKQLPSFLEESKKQSPHFSPITKQKNEVEIPYKRKGTAVFRSVERTKTPGFCHYFRKEGNTEIKYQPKYDLILNKAPSFSISKANKSFSTSNNGFNKQLSLDYKDNRSNNEMKQLRQSRFTSKRNSQDLIFSLNPTAYLDNNQEGQSILKDTTFLNQQQQEERQRQFSPLKKNEDKQVFEFYGNSKKGFDIQMDKQTKRASITKIPVSLDESRFNNFQFTKFDDSKTHAFDSYTIRKVFEPKEFLPTYNITKVNYDRVLQNDKHNRGNVSLNCQRVIAPFTTKHEIANCKENISNTVLVEQLLRCKYSHQNQSRIRPRTSQIFSQNRRVSLNESREKQMFNI